MTIQEAKEVLAERHQGEQAHLDALALIVWSDPRSKVVEKVAAQGSGR